MQSSANDSGGLIQWVQSKVRMMPSFAHIAQALDSTTYHNGFWQYCPPLTKSRIPTYLEKYYVFVHFTWKDANQRPILYEK